MKRLMILAALLSSCHHEARPAEAVKSAPAPAAAPKAPEPPRPSDAEQAALGQQPTVEPLSPFDAPAPRIERLANGLAVYVVERILGPAELRLKATAPGATPPNMRKDLHLVRELAQELGVNLYVGTQASLIADAGVATGHDDPRH